MHFKKQQHGILNKHPNGVRNRFAQPETGNEVQNMQRETCEMWGCEADVFREEGLSVACCDVSWPKFHGYTIKHLWFSHLFMSIDTKYQTNVYFLHSSTSCSGLFHTALAPVWSFLINNFTHKAKVLSDWTWTCSHTDDFLQSAKTAINLAVQVCFLPLRQCREHNI